MSLESTGAQQGSLQPSGYHCGSVGLSGRSLVLGRDQWRSVGGHWELLGLSGSQLVLLKFSGDQ